MFATRGHNENAIYDQQTAAAAKPLNQGVKGLAPKTPGNKAPKIPRNDENAAFGPGKTGGKGKDGGLFGKGEGGKADKSAFLTPAGPRTRAPLGNKTTNAKATAFLTPAPPSAKPSSPRLRRAKVKIHQAETDPLESDANGEREVEYMPPRGVPLPDHPDDCWPRDRTYPQFEGKNLTKGWWSEVQPVKDGEGSEEELSDFGEKYDKAEERRKKEAAGVGKVGADKAVAQARKTGVAARAPSTLTSRTAASALSAVPKASKTPSFAAPTAAAKARQPSALASRKPTGTASAHGNTRHTAAKVASNTTLGYSKGRAVSATARKPLAGLHGPAVSGEAAKIASANKTPFGGGTTFDELLGLGSLTVGDEADDEDDGLLGGDAAAASLDVDDELADFQLDPVEL